MGLKKFLRPRTPQRKYNNNNNREEQKKKNEASYNSRNTEDSSIGDSSTVDYYLPDHISLRSDDVSTIQYGESVTSPARNKNRFSNNTNPAKQSTAELNMSVPLWPNSIKVMNSVDGEISTLGGDSSTITNEDNNNNTNNTNTIKTTSKNNTKNRKDTINNSNNSNINISTTATTTHNNNNANNLKHRNIIRNVSNLDPVKEEDYSSSASITKSSQNNNNDSLMQKGSSQTSRSNKTGPMEKNNGNRTSPPTEAAVATPSESQKTAQHKPEVRKPEAPKSEVRKQEVRKPKVPKAAAPKPEVPKAAAPKAAAPKPEVSKPEVSKPAAPKPEVLKPEVPKPAVSKPTVPKPEAPKPELSKPEAPKPEVSKPEVAKPEVRKPEGQTIETNCTDSRGIEIGTEVTESNNNNKTQRRMEETENTRSPNMLDSNTIRKHEQDSNENKPVQVYSMMDNTNIKKQSAVEMRRGGSLIKQDDSDESLQEDVATEYGEVSTIGLNTIVADNMEPDKIKRLFYDPFEDSKTANGGMTVFCLSLLKRENSKEAKSLAERIALDSLHRHMDLYRKVKKDNNNNNNGTMTTAWKNTSSNLDDIDFSSQQLDPERIKFLARQQIADGKVGNAIIMERHLLEQQRNNHRSGGGSSSSSSKTATDTSDTLRRLAILTLHQEQKRAALEYAKRALKLDRDGIRQDGIAISLIVLGLIYFSNNKPDRTLDLWREALQTSCLAFGYDHPYIAVILNNLGCLHYQSGDFVACHKTLFECLNLQQSFLHSSTIRADLLLLDIAVTKGNIAMLTARNGDSVPALSMLQEVLSLQESVLRDRDHGLVQLTSYNLTRLEGVIDEQQKLQKQQKKQQKQKHASSSVYSSSMKSKTTGSRSDASRTSRTVRSDQATLQRNETFEIEQTKQSSTSVFGDDDGIPMRRVGGKSPIDALDETDILDVIMLGSLSQEYTPRQRVRAVVLAWFGKTLQNDEDGHVPWAPFGEGPRKRMPLPVDVDGHNIIDAELHLHSIHEQAAEHLTYNEVDEALEIFESVLRSHKEKYGDIHHLVGTANHNIGMVHLFAERYEKALTAFQEAVTVRRAALGAEHPDVGSSLMKIGMVQLANRDANTARDTFTEVLKLVRNALGHGHFEVARVLNNLAISWYDQGDYVAAFRSLQEAHEIQRRLLQLANAEKTKTVLKNQIRILELALANTLNNMGFLYCRDKKYLDSIQMLNEASKLRRKHLGEHHSSVEDVENNITYIRDTFGYILAREEQQYQKLQHDQQKQQQDEKDGKSAPSGSFYEIYVLTTLETFTEQFQCI